MSFRSFLLVLSIPCLPLLGLAQTPTAATVIADMVAYVKIPAPVNPNCAFHAVSTTVTLTDKNLSYAAASKLFAGTATAQVLGSKVVYNTLVSSRVPFSLREFTAGNATSMADRKASVSLGWAGAKPTLLGTITLTLADGKSKTYDLPVDMKVNTLAASNKYILSGTLANGSVVTIYLEKSAHSDCK